MSSQGGVQALRRTSVAGLLGLLVTVVVVFSPQLRFAYRSLEGRLIVDTAVALVAALAALLLFGRYRRGAGLADLLLVHAMALLSVGALISITLRPLFEDDGAGTASSWAALVLSLLGAVLVVIASLAGDRKVHQAVRPVFEVIGAVLALAVAAMIVILLSSQLPSAVEVRVSPEESVRPQLHGHPLVLAVQVTNLACYAVAAIAFTRRAARRGDDLLGWLGAASALNVWARLNYVLFPSLYTEWFYVGDLLRLGFYVLLLVGAVREIQQYWSAQAVAAAESERRRLARDLHDGVVQELGYIKAVAARFRATDQPAAERIIDAANRALDESRRSINALAAEPDEPLSDSLRTSVAEVGDRYDVPVEIEADGDVEVSADQREALLRIAREAVVNAARHANPTTIWVSVAPGEVTVRDDGAGFVPGGERRAGSFGMVSMRERAEAIGARLEVVSRLGEGTTVTVTW